MRIFRAEVVCTAAPSGAVPGLPIAERGLDPRDAMDR